MYVKNAVYREIVPNWDEITLPLKAGTPMSASGKVANNANAVGLVPQTIDVRPALPSIRILIGGNVLLAEVNALYGSDLASEAKQAMGGIVFYGSDGTPEPDPLFVIPDDVGGAPEVFTYSGYITKEAKSGTEYRYTKAELTQLLTDNPFVVWKTTVTYNGLSYYGLAFIWKPSGSTNASVAVISPQVPVVYYGAITLTGTQTGYVSAPSLNAPSSGSAQAMYEDDFLYGSGAVLYQPVKAALQAGRQVVFVVADTSYPTLWYEISDMFNMLLLQCGPYLITLYEGDSDNTYSTVGWPGSDGGGGGGTGDQEPEPFEP